MKSKTRIIATVGPSSSTVKVLKAMYYAGVNVFRVNMSHGEHSEHRKIIQEIRKVPPILCQSPAIMIDLQGPKIRVGKLKNPVNLKENGEIIITTKNIIGSGNLIPTTYNKIINDVHKGETILLDDGKIELRVKNILKHEIICTVKTGGLLKEHKGINLPNVYVSAPSLTKKDIMDLEFGIKEKVDYIALSFVRSAKDIDVIKSLLRKRNSDIPVIAKIEKPQAVENIDEILKKADGVMVARGDLGVEMSPQKVPVIQKKIIHEANRLGKIVITATQMLETMTNSPTPTRAEASDVANAIFDGTDAVMLSGETSVGKYPVGCVRMMREIADEAEHSAFNYKTTGTLDFNIGFLPNAIVESAFHASKEIQHSAIVVFTRTGESAIYMSKLRPPSPIVALTPDPCVCRRLSLTWGVRAIFSPFSRNFDDMVEKGERELLRSGLLKKGQIIIIVAGTLPSKGGTNIMKLHRL